MWFYLNLVKDTHFNNVVYVNFSQRRSDAKINSLIFVVSLRRCVSYLFGDFEN